jgi:hypothetical protein
VDELDRIAVEIGRKKAQEVLETPPSLKAKAKVIGASGVLVAEGDSWFDYPGKDVLGRLEDAYGYDVRSLARRGDRVEEMAYAAGQLKDLKRLLEKIINKKEDLKAVLLSGGGNDVAGREFGMLLNHAESGISGLNKLVIDGVIDLRARVAYTTMISSITEVCQGKLGAPVPILVHGYDYPVPDGRGYFGGWWLLPGPWLDPGFREKGYSRDDMRERIRITRELIDRFNSMLERVVSLEVFPHVRYVDLRKTLSKDIDSDEWWSKGWYREWWDNELHPTDEGFDLVTERFAEALGKL